MKTIVKMFWGTGVFVIGCLVGIIVDRFIHNIPLFELDPKIRIFEPLTFLLTLFIGIFLPLYIKRMIEDKRRSNDFVIDNLHSLVNSVNGIQQSLKEKYLQGSISANDKTIIQALFDQTDLVMSDTKSLVKDFYGNRFEAEMDKVYNAYIDYWKHLSGAIIMSTKFKLVTEEYFKKSNELYHNFEVSVNAVIVTLFK